MDKQDPYDFLMNAGSDPAVWMLVAGPAALLVLILVTVAILIAVRRRRDARELAKDVEAAGIGGGAEAPPVLRTPAELQPPPPAEIIDITPPAEREPAPPAPLRRGDVDEVRQTDRTSWMERLRAGLARTRENLFGSLSGIFSGSTKLDAGVLERLNEALYRADVGVATADRLTAALKARLGKEEAADWPTVSACLKDEIRAIMAKSASPAAPTAADGTAIPVVAPRVILVVGVNGVGKTTTVGKLGAHFLAADQTVLMAAADTFRAAAIDQLKVWGERLGVDVVAHKQGGDPAAVAYDAAKAAVARHTDVLLVDTAGRLHNKNELMAELGKINRVLGKDVPGAPHETWLVVDATTGQNAVQQVKAFREVVPLTGLVVTKLDGTAKGGVLIGIADQFGLPIRFVGVGEKAADLRAFDVNDFVSSLF